MSYLKLTDLENALSKSIVASAYDDDHDGTPDAAPIQACIDYAVSQCNSFLRNTFTENGTAIELPLTIVPDEVKFAAIDFAIAYSIRRRPDIIKAITSEPWPTYYKHAKEQMERYCASQQRLPAEVGTPATAGGALLNPDTDDDGAEQAAPDQPSRWADLDGFA